MSGVNKVIILGNLGKDPEVRFMPNGDSVANLTIATSESWKDKTTGEKKEKTEWHRVVIFGKLAEIAGQYLKKGAKVYLEGALQTRKWTNNEGVEVWTTEIVLQGFGGKMEMLGGNQQGGSNGQSTTHQQAGSQSNQQQGGFTGQQQQGSFSGQQQSTSPSAQGGQNNKVKPQEKVDFDDDIPF